MRSRNLALRVAVVPAVIVLSVSAGFLSGGAEKEIKRPLPKMLKDATQAFDRQLASCICEMTPIEAKAGGPDARRLSAWEKKITPEQKDGSETLGHHHVLAVLDHSDSGLNFAPPRVVWFAYDWEWHCYLNPTYYAWDIAYDRSTNEAYLVRVAAESMRANAKIKVYAVNMTATVNPDVICLDRMPKEGKDPPGAEPWAEHSFRIPKPEKPVERATDCHYTNVRAVCHKGRLLVYLTRSDEGRAQAFSCDTATKKWKEVNMPE